MIIAIATHQKLTGEIQRLIHNEQYERAQELLPNFAQAVVEAFNASGQEQEFLQAKQFLQSAVVAVKSRQAHYLIQMEDLRRQRAYTGVSDRNSSFDISG